MKLIEKLYESIERYKYHRLLTQLRSAGLSINVVFDIGAHKGRWTKEHRSIFPTAHFYLFEANQEHLPKLQRFSENCFIGVLSSDGLPAKFYRKVGTGDSLYRENTIHYSDSKFDLVPTQTLDALCIEHKLPKTRFHQIGCSRC